MENLPNLLTLPRPTPAAPDRGATLPPGAALAIASVAAILTTSCAHSTDGTATTKHTAPTTTGALAAPRPSSTAGAPSTPAVSAEDQARQIVIAYGDAYNSQNWEAYTELMCTPMRLQYTGVVMDYVKKGRAVNGPATIRSMTITITGDDAMATINGASEGLGPGTIQLPLKREDGWKVCKLK